MWRADYTAGVRPDVAIPFTTETQRYREQSAYLKFSAYRTLDKVFEGRSNFRDDFDAIPYQNFLVIQLHDS